MTNAIQPKISVIIPVYNAESFIDECLSSVIKQSFSDFEIILVDDKSTDDSYKICERYAEKDNRIKLIHNQTNQGSSISRKIGLDNSKGLYIQFIDADDWIDENMFGRLYKTVIEQNADIIWHDFIDGDCAYRKQNIESLEKLQIYKQLLNCESKLSTALFNKLIKRETLLRVNFPAAMQWEDLVITIQSIHNADKISYLPNGFYHHRYNPTSISRSTERKTKAAKELIENVTIAVDYFRGCLGSSFLLLEPELSVRVNHIKWESLFIGELLNSKAIVELYPESSKNIFNKTWNVSFVKKMILYGYLKNMAISSFLVKIIKCVKY